METTAPGKTKQSSGIQTSAEIEMDTTVEDKFLRKALVDASTKMEQMLESGEIEITSRIIPKTEWGLETEIEMSRPKEDKPIIFKYTYRVDRVAFKHWIDEHKYLMEGNALVFGSRGLTVLIPGPGVDDYHKLMAEFVLKYTPEDEEDLMHRIDIIDTSVVLLVHREVVNNHDWIVKCIIP